MYGTFVSRNVDVNFVVLKDKDICRVTVRPASQPLFNLYDEQRRRKE